MTQHVIQYQAGRYVCGVTTTGRVFRRTGCGHVLPASAIAHSDTLQATPRPAADDQSALSGGDEQGRTGAPHGGRETGGGQALRLRRRKDASRTCVETTEKTGLDPSGLAPSMAPGLRNRKLRTQVDPSRVVPAVIAVVTGGAPLPAGSDAALSRSSEPEGSPGPTAAARLSGSPDSVTPVRPSGLVRPTGDPSLGLL